MFKNVYLNRSQKMYREAIFNLAVLKHCLKIKGKKEGLVLKNALNKELELYNYDRGHCASIRLFGKIRLAGTYS